MSSKVGGIARAPVWGANPFDIIIIIILFILLECFPIGLESDDVKTARE